MGDFGVHGSDGAAEPVAVGLDVAPVVSGERVPSAAPLDDLEREIVVLRGRSTAQA